MMCFRDRTYCPYDTCYKWSTCNCALTKKVQDSALVWWGKPDPPICVYAEKPKCFKEST